MVKPAEIIQTFGNKVRVRVCGVYTEKNNILLVKHLYIGKAGYLWAPPGGGLNFGETAEECLIREFKEEVGLEIRIKEFLCVNEFFSDPLHAIELFFIVEKTGGKLEKGTDPELSPHNQMIADVKFCDDDFIYNEKQENLHGLLNFAGGISKVLKLKGYFSFIK